MKSMFMKDGDYELRLVPGTRVLDERLEIVREIAQGGTAIVYRAFDHDRGTVVALKIVTTKANWPDTEERYANEMRLGASLAGHPHVVRSLSSGKLDGPEGFEGRMFLATEYIEGASLAQLMAHYRKGMPPQRACAIASDVARALIGLHKRGIVHRDIKPGNVLVTGDVGSEHTRLIDFGFAYATGDGWEEKSPDLTEEGHAPGTPLYMSPQQAAHSQPEPAFDIYSLGVVLYELLSGNPPDHNVPQGILLARKCDPNKGPYPISKVCPELPAQLTTLVDRCVSFDGADRPSAKEVLLVLEHQLLASSKGIPAPPSFGRLPSAASPPGVNVIAPSAKPTSKRRRAPAWPFAIVAGLVGAAVWAVWPTPGPDRISENQQLSAASAVYVEARSEPSGTVPSPKVALPQEENPDPAPAESVVAESVVAESVVAAPVVPPPTKPKRSPRPGASKSKRKPKQAIPSQPEHETQACRDDVAAASSAAASKQWAQVLRRTKKSKCWEASRGPERTKMRTRAFFETEQYAACARCGRGSSNADVGRWTAICEMRALETTTP
ncbi:MAG: protein kinase [Nannocystaceae bacterium]|nr:protein kinase [Nannocystaceae bacterium]